MYADYLTREEEMKSMLRRFNKYLERKRLKKKVFKKGGREKNYKWEWGK